MKVFMMSIKVSQLEEKIKNLAQQVAIQNHDMNHKIDEE